MAMMGQFAVDLLTLCALLKHSAFKEESEWRLVLPMHGGTIPKFGKRQFRAGSSTLIPYMEFNLTESGPMPLTDVMLGPGSEPETSVEAAHSFLLTEKSNVIPQMSKAPFRPW